MKRLLKIGLIFFTNYIFIESNCIAQNNISSYQYWFDNDYGSNIQTAISPTENLVLNSAIPLETLSDGLHIFNIRFKDTDDRWSITSGDFFYYNDLTANNVNSYQYWFDHNYAVQSTEVVAPNSQLILNTGIDLQNVSNGLHIFSIRFKDDKGKWSIPQNQYFYFNNLTDSNIVTYQYWFDNNIDANTLVLTSPAQHMQLTEMIPIENIEEGLHMFSIRFKDDKGNWSVPMNQYFYKSNHAIDNKITAYRYWINEDFDNAIYVSVDSPTQLLNLSENIDFPGLAIGNYTIHFQFKDSSDNWSVVTADDFELTSLSVIENTFDKFITAYPNPTKSDVYFDLGESYGLIQIKIFDNTGRFIQQESYVNLQKFKLSINNNADGIYFIMIIADDKKATFKFVKY